MGRSACAQPLRGGGHRVGVHADRSAHAHRGRSAHHRGKRRPGDRCLRPARRSHEPGDLTGHARDRQACGPAGADAADDWLRRDGRARAVGGRVHGRPSACGHRDRRLLVDVCGHRHATRSGSRRPARTGPPERRERARDDCRGAAGQLPGAVHRMAWSLLRGRAVGRRDAHPALLHAAADAGTAIGEWVGLPRAAAPAGAPRHAGGDAVLPRAVRALHLPPAVPGDGHRGGRPCTVAHPPGCRCCGARRHLRHREPSPNAALQPADRDASRDGCDRRGAGARGRIAAGRDRSARKLGAHRHGCAGCLVDLVEQGAAG